jgi:paraquat-inducible protein B
VRYRGVQIGRVTEISLASATYRRPEGEPFAGAFQLVLVRFAVDEQRLGDVPTMHEAVELGLRIRITAQGITGVNYVELDFVNPERFPMPRVPWTPAYPFVPSIPSTVEQVRSAAENLMTRLAEVPLEEIMENFSTLLGALRTQATDGDAAVALREAARTAGLLRETLERSQIEQSLQEFREAAAAARELIAGPELRGALGNIAAATAELRRATQQLPGTLATLERTTRTARETTQEVQAELIPILSNLRATTASLRATAEALRNSPSQALFGAPPPPPQDRRR